MTMEETHDELADRQGELDVANARLAKLHARREELDAAATRALDTAESARRAIREAETDEARSAGMRVLADAAANAEAAMLQTEGVDEKISAAVQAVEKAARQHARVAARLVVEHTRALEKEALALAERLGMLLRRRRQLARLAMTQASTAAGGSLVDPLGADDMANDFTRAIDERLHPKNAVFESLLLSDIA